MFDVDQKTGGPAFPEPISVSPSGDTYSSQSGMSLRDWFAGQAIGALIAVTSSRQHDPGNRAMPVLSTNERIAFDAYEMADALLRVRNGLGRANG